MSDVGPFVAILLLFNIVNIDSARILAVFPTPSISHQVVFRPLTEELVKRGHEVVVVTTDPAFPKGETPKNLTEIDFHDLSYSIWQEYFLTTSAGKEDDLYTQYIVIMRLMQEIMEKQFSSKEIQNLVKDKKGFDLLILEAHARPLLVFSHFFKVPVIQFSSFGSSFTNYESLGAPTHDLLYPVNVRQRLYNLTLWEKITELYSVNRMKYFYRTLEDEENAMLKKVFGDDVPSVNEMLNNIDLLFLNIHPLWEGIRPVTPNVIYVNGIHEKPEMELPKDLKNFLDSSKNGIIYISFGTNVKPSLLPPERIQVLVNALSKLPYDILWKWDKDDLPGRSKNIKISKWLPQSDLLRHPNVRLFVTQGGLQSSDEAINAGVPLIGIPMIADQWFNVEQYVYHKIGIRLDLPSITEEKFVEAINKVIEDESYRRNIKRLRSLMKDHPQTPLERAVWWTEYVLRHGGAKHLRSPAANMPWTEYYEIKLVLTLLSSLIISVIFVALLLFYLYRVFRRLINKGSKVKSS